MIQHENVVESRECSRFFTFFLLWSETSFLISFLNIYMELGLP